MHSAHITDDGFWEMGDKSSCFGGSGEFPVSVRSRTLDEIGIEGKRVEVDAKGKDVGIRVKGANSWPTPEFVNTTSLVSTIHSRSPQCRRAASVAEVGYAIVNQPTAPPPALDELDNGLIVRQVGHTKDPQAKPVFGAQNHGETVGGGLTPPVRSELW